jgi:hypothetical protein
MGTLAIPEDHEAERALAGGLLAQGLAVTDLDHLAADDFYRPDFRRVAVAAGELSDLPRFYSDLPAFRSPADLPAQLVDLAYDLPTRRGVIVAAAAFLAEVPGVVVAGLMADAPPRSLLPSLAARLADAARRRRAMGAAGEVYNRLGSGASVESVAPLLAKVAA